MEQKYFRKLKSLEQKYNFESVFCDLIPYEHIPDTIKVVLGDVQSVNRMIETDNKDILSSCEKLKVLLIDVLEYLKTKLERFLDI